MLTPVTRLSEDALFTWCKPRLGTRRWLRLDVTCMRGRQTVRLAISPCEHQKLSTMGASLLYARSSIIRKRAAGIAAAMRCPICGEVKRASRLWATGSDRRFSRVGPPRSIAGRPHVRPGARRVRQWFAGTLPSVSLIRHRRCPTAPAPKFPCRETSRGDAAHTRLCRQATGRFRSVSPIRRTEEAVRRDWRP